MYLLFPYVPRQVLYQLRKMKKIKSVYNDVSC